MIVEDRPKYWKYRNKCAAVSFPDVSRVLIRDLDSEPVLLEKESGSMPIFEFECDECHHRFEELRRNTDPTTPECPSCKGKKARKLISAGAIRSSGISTGSAGYAAPSCSPGGG